MLPKREETSTTRLPTKIRLPACKIGCAVRTAPATLALTFLNSFTNFGNPSSVVACIKPAHEERTDIIVLTGLVEPSTYFALRVILYAPCPAGTLILVV